MLRLDKVIKPWKNAAALSDHISLYGFWNETAFLTKSGDLGMVLNVTGVDYESLDHAGQEYAVKRLESALKAFGPGFHIYQYLFKSNRPEIPFAGYDSPVVQEAVDYRRRFFEEKADSLYQIEIFYCILLEGSRSKTGVRAALAQLFRDPAGAVNELNAQFTNSRMKTLLRAQIERDLARLDIQVQGFARQLADFVRIEILNQQGQFRFFRRLVNYDEWRIAGEPKHSQFLDYQVVNSDIEAERDHLRVADGQEVSYDPRRLTGVSVYREIDREFSVGDRIQFTAPDKELGVANRDLAVIDSIAPDGLISARLDNNREVEFNAHEHRHFDHGYAVTSHSSQGLTAERVLVNADTGVHPDLLNSRFGYVSVSRASHEATVFTDNLAKLNPQLSADVSKTSALEINQPAPVAQEIGIGIGI